MTPHTKPAQRGTNSHRSTFAARTWTRRLQPLEFHYIAGPVTLENTGRGIVVHVDPGSWMVAGGVRY